LNPRSIDVARSANLIVSKLLAVKPGEQVALVCDPHSEMSMVYALAGATQNVGAEYTILMMPTRETERKNDLTTVIEQGLEAADCLIGLTGSCGAPTYSAAVRRLYDLKKLRTISMVMRDLDNFTQGGALADYEALYEEGQRLATVWQAANQSHLSTPAGTELSAPISGEAVFVECGFATKPGQEAAFSDGEVSQMPRQGTAQGMIVVDGPIAHVGLPDEPIRLHVRDGRVAAVDGISGQANELRQIIEHVDNADNIAEIGLGLNPACRQNGDFEEEKKGRGNVHVAIGDNVFYGGEVRSPVHMDMVLYRPTVRLDDRVIVEDGVVLI
jgi:leucyl aminopeptidase (aminopeptidase T)